MPLLLYGLYVSPVTSGVNPAISIVGQITSKIWYIMHYRLLQSILLYYNITVSNLRNNNFALVWFTSNKITAEVWLSTLKC